MSFYPAHDFINVDVRSDASTLAYQLMDCNGRVVMNETRDNRIANTILSIALPKDLSNGIYFLKTTDGNNKSAMAKVFVYN